MSLTESVFDYNLLLDKDRAQPYFLPKEKTQICDNNEKPAILIKLRAFHATLHLSYMWGRKETTYKSALDYRPNCNQIPPICNIRFPYLSMRRTNSFIRVSR